MSITATRRHPRHRALAELDRLIQRAEAVVARRRLETGHVEADGRRAVRSRALLHWPAPTGWSGVNVSA